MKSICLTITLILSCLSAVTIGAQTITNGIPWYDQDGKPVSAHGANIIRDGGKYYMFGEFKTDSANVFTGFSCYSSSNLSDWRFEGIAFSQQSPSLSSQPSKAGAQLWRMGPNRVGERPKVLKCPKTGEYVMLMHTDNMQYKDPCTCYATSKTITGPYEFQGPILYKGKPVTKWDIGSFMDDDGRGYLLVHHGMIYRLAEDFHSLDSCLMSGVKGAGESPAMMKKDGIYYWMSSHTTSWERNDNMYWTATSLGGPWTYRGEFCPVGSLTWNSQCSFLLSIDGQWIYMGDRWSFPRQHQAATYVWLPIEAKDSVLSIPEYMESWDVATGKPVSLPLKTMAEGRTLSNPGDSFTVKFIAQNSKLNAQSSKLEGTRIGLKGRTDENSGYAEITILNNKQQVVFETSVDFYSKTPATGLRWLSPVLPQGEYTLLVRCSEMKPNWTDKKRIIYGSKGHKVEVSEVVTVIDHATAQTATWIWYPGDMDIWTGSRINDLRTENGSYYPAFWRNDYHYQTVEFSKTFQLDEAEEVAINAEGHYGVRIDSHGYVFGMPKTFTVPKGRHTLRISVHNMTSPPAIWLKGKTIVSDTTWTVSNFADAQRADTWYEMDGTPTFAKPTERPSEYRLPTTPIQPIKQQKDGNTLFAEFAREGIGYLQLNGVKGNGQINICYGESPDEARDKQHAYLKDRVLFTQDSIVDLQTKKGTYRPQAYVQESAIPSQTPLTSYRLPSSRAMRYVTVETEGDVSVESVTLLSEMKDLTPGSVRESAISSQTPLPSYRGSFTCSDTLLNRIWDVSAYTLHLTDREVMIEGIKRDRWMWSGDAIQSYLMNYYAFMDAPVVRRTIWALRGKDPVQQHINTILDYTFYWFNSVYDYYLYTGDSQFLRRIYPRMLSLMTWVEGRLNSRGMVEGKKGDWVFVDWSPQKMSKSGELAFEQMVYLRSLEAIRLCAGIIGDKANAAKYDKQAQTLRSQLTPVFWNNDLGAFIHTMAQPNSVRESAISSQTNSQFKIQNSQFETTRYANIFAVLYGYADKEQSASILNKVLLNDSVMPITTPYMRFYELEALCALGKQQRVLKEMRSYWGGMLHEGATTFWETYDPTEQYPQRLAMYGHRYGKSLCHAWGASPIYLLGKYYLGIQPTKAGYEAWECRPCLGGLKWMKGDVPTPHGNIHIEMTRRQVTIEATGCGTGTLFIGKKRITIEPNKRITTKY